MPPRRPRGPIGCPSSGDAVHVPGERSGALVGGGLLTLLALRELIE